MTTIKRRTTWRNEWDTDDNQHGYTELFTNAIRVLIVGIITVVVFGIGFMAGGAMLASLVSATQTTCSPYWVKR